MRTVVLILVLLPMGYVVLMNSARSQTLGKIICGLKIVSPTFDRISYGQALLRYFMEFVLGSLSLGVMYVVRAMHQQNWVGMTLYPIRGRLLGDLEVR